MKFAANFSGPAAALENFMSQVVTDLSAGGAAALSLFPNLVDVLAAQNITYVGICPGDLVPNGPGCACPSGLIVDMLTAKCVAQPGGSVLCEPGLFKKRRRAIRHAQSRDRVALPSKEGNA